MKNQGWVKAGLAFEGRLDSNTEDLSIFPFIEPNAKSHDHDVTLPFWQTAPVPNSSMVNFDLLEFPVLERAFLYVNETHRPLLTEVVDPYLLSTSINIADGHPRSFIVAPIFDDFASAKKVVGILTTNISWEAYFKSASHRGSNGLVVVVANACGDKFTYMLTDTAPIFLGHGDLHEAKYESISETISFNAFRLDGEDKNTRIDCHYNFTVYPSETMINEYTSERPVYIALSVVMVFVVVSVMFLLYDKLVQVRQVSRYV